MEKKVAAIEAEDNNERMVYRHQRLAKTHDSHGQSQGFICLERAYTWM
jgi:hypothetical protein